MSISISMIEQLIMVWGFICAILIPTTYWLAKRKTRAPIIITIVIFLLTLFPPICLICLFILALKQDLVEGK